MKQYGPWKIKERNLKYQNPWVKVYEDKVIRPDGKDGIHVFIDIKKGVSVLPLDEEGNVYLTKEFHYGAGEVTIEAVAGGIEKDEPYLNAAKRELKEELGIVAEKWIDLGPITQITAMTNYYNRSFLVRKLTFTKKEPDGTETAELIKMKLDQAVTMVMENKITNSLTCMLLLKAKEYLNRRK